MVLYSSNCMAIKKSTELQPPFWEKTNILNIVQDHLQCSWESLLCRLPAKTSHLWILPSWQLPGISFWIKLLLSCPTNTSIRIKIFKNPNTHQQTKMILIIPITASVSNVKSKSVQSKESPSYLLTPQAEQTSPHKWVSDLPMQLITGTQTKLIDFSFSLNQRETKALQNKSYKKKKRNFYMESLKFICKNYDHVLFLLSESSAHYLRLDSLFLKSVSFNYSFIPQLIYSFLLFLWDVRSKRDHRSIPTPDHY